MIRNIVWYLLFLCITGLLGILYNEYYMGIIFLTLSVVPIVFLGALFYLQKKIRASMYIDSHVVQKGEVFPITFQFENPTIFPIPYVDICFTYMNKLSGKSYKQVLEVSIDSNTSTVVHCQLKSDHVGNIEINLKKIRYYDYFRLFRWSQKKQDFCKVAVLPAINELEMDIHHQPSTPIEEGESFSSNQKGDDPSEIFEIREYRGGDRISRVHWKLTMKQDQLMIKEFSEPIYINTLLYVDMYAQQNNNLLNEMDERMELALSLSYTLLSKGENHYVTWYDQRYGICQRRLISSEEDFYEFVSVIMETGPYSTDDDGIFMFSSQYPNFACSRLLYTSSKMNHINWESMDILNAKDKVIVMRKEVYDINRALVDEWKSKAELMGIHFTTVEGSGKRYKDDNVRKKQEGGKHGSKKKRRHIS